MPSVQAVNFSSFDFEVEDSSALDEFEEAQEMCSFEYNDDAEFVLE